MSSVSRLNGCVGIENVTLQSILFYGYKNLQNEADPGGDSGEGGVRLLFGAKWQRKLHFVKNCDACATLQRTLKILAYSSTSFSISPSPSWESWQGKAVHECTWPPLLLRDSFSQFLLSVPSSPYFSSLSPSKFGETPSNMNGASLSPAAPGPSPAKSRLPLILGRGLGQHFLDL